MRRLAWTFAARIDYKYQIRLTRPKWHVKEILDIAYNNSTAPTLCGQYILNAYTRKMFCYMYNNSLKPVLS